MTCQRAGASGRQPGRRTGDGVTNFEINAARYALIAIGSPRVGLTTRGCCHAVGQMVGWVGIEPTTTALKGRCSTAELPTRPSEGAQSTRLFTRLALHEAIASRVRNPCQNKAFAP